MLLPYFLNPDNFTGINVNTEIGNHPTLPGAVASSSANVIATSGEDLLSLDSSASATGPALKPQLVWTDHPLAGVDSQYDNSKCWFEQDPDGVGRWEGCGQWVRTITPGGSTGGQWVQDAVPD